MSRTAAHVTQADIARALRAVEQTGARAIVEIAPDGMIRIVPTKNVDLRPQQAPVEPAQDFTV